jgi:pimeloyl-ACP methyl ester carboxylesterase
MTTIDTTISAGSDSANAQGAARGIAAAELAHEPLQIWYGGGERRSYDPARRAMGGGKHGLKVFVRREGDVSRAVSFLPGFPDGSSGWARVLPYLPAASAMPKLFLDYVGMGDSDTPSDDYRFSTAERTDLVEALWRDLGVRSTTLVAFDFSSLVVLEHLRRRLERAARGEREGGPEIRGVLIFNGGLFTDGHTHPWWTTPVLRRLPARSGPVFASQSFGMFMMMGGIMWSRRFAGRTEAGRRVYESLRRRDGMSYLSRAAAFAADHKAQAERLDFGRLYSAWRDRFPFLVGGSAEDAFEHRQVDLAERRLARFGLEIARLPGGHMTTDEEPRALAELIARFEQKLGAQRPK